MNGTKTLGENVADNCGIKASFHGFKEWEEKNGQGPLLPGFDEYTYEQLYYIGFANVSKNLNYLVSLSHQK